MICRAFDSMKIETVAVFCAASENISPRFAEYAREVGEMIARMGLNLVYGGAAAGLMEETAKAVHDNGGFVIGVVPEILEQNRRVSRLLNEKVITRNLSERKDYMQNICDVFIALPGGIGTLDEVFHILAAATIGYHDKKIIFYNAGGFWNTLLTVLEQLGEEGFIRAKGKELFFVADDCNALKELLESDI